MLSRLSRRGAGSTAQALLWWRRDSWACTEPHVLRQAVGLTAAATGSNDGGASSGGGKANAASGNGNARLLARISSTFKSRAHANDAAGAEHAFRDYVRAGGEPQQWMLPMLLGTYGRLRQADKAWAIYCHLLALRNGGQQEPQAAPAAAAAGEGAAGAWQQADANHPGSQPQQPQPQQQQGGSTSPPRHPQQQRQGPAAAAGWGGRLEQRQRQLAAEAARLVADLRLGEAPFGQFAFGSLITALSRAEHPPYDLPALYAERAAAAFADMEGRGVEPNVVLWHNLMDCQAKAGMPDAAFETYRRMRAAAAQPTSWTFSILVSAFGRAGQPQRAAEVVEQLMPQAGVTPELPVWNSLLGAYGRAGSVDAAYASWLKMLDSGVVPDDCTERALALAFGSHPALAADVVAEARQVQQQRRWEQQQQRRAQRAEAQGGAPAAAAALGGGWGVPVGEPSSSQLQQQQQRQQQRFGGQSGGAGATPYRLFQHRQAPLEMGHVSSHVSNRCQTRNRPLGLLLDGRSRGEGASDADSGGDRGPGEGGAAVAEQEESGLQLRQLLLLDLHGSSQAAARMVLLRRLETLVLQAPELVAEVARLEAQWHQQRQWRQQHRLLRRQKKRQASALLASLAADAAVESGGAGGRGSAGRPGKQLEQQQQRGGAGEWLTLGQQWNNPHQQQQQDEEGDESSSLEDGEDGEGEEEEQGPAGPQQGQQGRRVARFSPPAFCVVTGRGRHSRPVGGGGGGGVLKAAVREMLMQQGLPALNDPTNAGVVVVPWAQLSPYLQRQQQTMNTDRFLTAARVRYMYIGTGLAGLMAAAHILPRLTPWMA